MERWARVMERTGAAPPDDLPVVLAAEGSHGPVVHALNRAARLSGIQTGARVVDMRAICPDLQVNYADIEGDRRFLDWLRLWARRWCPWSVSDGDDGLILDTTGSDHLFGGEAAMLRDMEARFSGLGLTAQLAAAPTWGAAWGLARFGPVRAICPEAALAERLGPLPVKALRLPQDTLLLLNRLGLKRIADLAAIPRPALIRRFREMEPECNPLLRLDQAMGRLAEPVSSEEEEAPFRAICRLSEPIQDPTPHVPELCDALCDRLEAAGKGCRKLRLTIYHSDGEVSAVTVATSRPSREGAHLLRLFEGKLERINPGYGFDLILLEALAVEDLDETQNRLDGQPDDALHLARLIDRLSARFGARVVTRPAPRESHLPERAQDWVSAMAGPPGDLADPPTLDRPVRLIAPPEEIRVLYAVPEGPPAQFVWRRQTLLITRYAGPERIAPEWWQDRPGTRLRDYFKVEDHQGRRFWIYREGLADDGRGGAPRWFLHGMFL